MKQVFFVLLAVGVSLRAFGDAVEATQTTPQDLAERVKFDVSRGHFSWIKDEAALDIPILEKGTKDFPTDPQIYIALAYCYMGQGDKKNRLKCLQAAYALSPKDPAIALIYGMALNWGKQPLQALEVDKLQLTLHPDSLLWKFAVATMDMLIQKYDDALAILEPIAQNSSYNLSAKDKLSLFLNLGTCYLYKGDYVKAIEALHTAGDQWPSPTLADSTLGEAYLKAGDAAKAEAAFDKSLAIGPDWPPTLYYRGIILADKGNDKSAQQSFLNAYARLKKHLDQDNSTGQDYYLMYQICQKLSKVEEGEKNKAEAAQLLFTHEAPWKQN